MVKVQAYALSIELDVDTYNRLEKAHLIWSVLVAYVFPISFSAYVFITIWLRGLMPSEGRMKQLVRTVPSYVTCMDGFSYTEVFLLVIK
jgi:hypothetical protein